MYQHKHCSSHFILLNAVFYLTEPHTLWTHTTMITQMTYQTPTLSLCVQIKPQQMNGYQTQPAVALLPRWVPVQGLEDPQCRADLSPAQAFLEKLRRAQSPPAHHSCPGNRTNRELYWLLSLKMQDCLFWYVGAVKKRTSMGSLTSYEPCTPLNIPQRGGEEHDKIFFLQRIWKINIRNMQDPILSMCVCMRAFVVVAIVCVYAWVCVYVVLHVHACLFVCICACAFPSSRWCSLPGGI